MYSPELLNDLLITILCIQKELKGSDIEKVKVAQEAYDELLDDFYDEYEDKLASNQYMAAKDDPDYFSVLIKLAYHDQVQENVDKQWGTINTVFQLENIYRNKRRGSWQIILV